MFGAPDKPSAMEQMLSRMIGMTPGEMQGIITGLRDTIVTVADTLKRIEDNQGVIIAKLEGLENERGNGSVGGGDRTSAGRTRRRGGGTPAELGTGSDAHNIGGE